MQARGGRPQKGASATPPTRNPRRATRALFSNNVRNIAKCFIISEITSCIASNIYQCIQSVISLFILGIWLDRSCILVSSPCFTKFNRYHLAEDSCTRGGETRLRCSPHRDANQFPGPCACISHQGIQLRVSYRFIIVDGYFRTVRRPAGWLLLQRFWRRSPKCKRGRH